MNNKHAASTLLTYAATLMAVSAILMTACSKIAIGGMFLVAASLMFFSAYHFRVLESKNNKEETSDDE